VESLANLDDQSVPQSGAKSRQAEEAAAAASHPPLSFEVPRGLLERLKLAQLLRRFPQRLVWAGFMFVNGFVTIAILAAVAMISGVPFVFPSLGPTAFLLFFTPTAPTASPRNTIVGHAIGILCGYAALCITGLDDAQSASVTGVNGARIFAAALSLASTGALMILAKAAHPPAGATTLIISLGIVTRPFHLLIIELAVGLMVSQAIVINRLAGIDYPLWSPNMRRSAPSTAGLARGDDAAAVDGRR
jgi:CBS-domain-containing membrane protein